MYLYGNGNVHMGMYIWECTYGNVLMYIRGCTCVMYLCNVHICRYTYVVYIQYILSLPLYGCTLYDDGMGEQQAVPSHYPFKLQKKNSKKKNFRTSIFKKFSFIFLFK